MHVYPNLSTHCCSIHGSPNPVSDSLSKPFSLNNKLFTWICCFPVDPQEWLWWGLVDHGQRGEAGKHPPFLGSCSIYIRLGSKLLSIYLKSQLLTFCHSLAQWRNWVKLSSCSSEEVVLCSYMYAQRLQSPGSEMFYSAPLKKSSSASTLFSPMLWIAAF